MSPRVDFSFFNRGEFFQNWLLRKHEASIPLGELDKISATLVGTILLSYHFFHTLVRGFHFFSSTHAISVCGHLVKVKPTNCRGRTDELCLRLFWFVSLYPLSFQFRLFFSFFVPFPLTTTMLSKRTHTSQQQQQVLTFRFCY